VEDHANLVLLRNQVDELDRKLLFLLRERLELVANIARQKRESLSSLRAPEREKAVLARVEALAGEAGLDPGLCRELFRVVLAMSVRVQEQALLGVHPHWARNAHRCCYQGSPYAYSHLAAQRFFGSKSRHMDFLGMPPLLPAFRRWKPGKQVGRCCPSKTPPPAPSTKLTTCSATPR
jgi:chorismate mutase